MSGAAVTQLVGQALIKPRIGGQTPDVHTVIPNNNYNDKNDNND